MTNQQNQIRDWSAVDWSRTNVEIALDLGVTRQAVSAARKREGAPASPAGHGGARPRDATPWARLRRAFVQLDAESQARLIEAAERELKGVSKN